MSYGVIPSAATPGATLKICAKSPRDDFEAGMAIDPGKALDGWPVGDCRHVRDLVVFNVETQSEAVGAVYHNANPVFDASVKRSAATTNVFLAATLAVLGGALIALSRARGK